MEQLEFPITAGALGARVGAEVVGDQEVEIRGLSPLKEAGEGSLTYFADKRLAPHLDQLRSAVLFTTPDLVRPELPLTYLLVDDPRHAFSGVARHFRRIRPWSGRSDQAHVHPEAVLAPGVSVGPFTVIGARARIGEGTSLGAQVYVGAGVEIGRDCVIHPRVSLLDGVKVGDRVQIFPGTVIGSDGFGFLPAEGDEGPVDVPQVGTVVIEDDVRIGANCTIDRATIGETRVGRGAKLDGLVHVGHNVRIGRHNLICAQAGIAGSAVLEDEVVLGGKAGVADNITVGKGARVGGGAEVFNSIPGGDTYLMSPAVPLRQAVRMLKVMRRLPEIWRRVKDLEARLGEKA